MISLPLVGDNVRENGFLLRLCNEKGGNEVAESDSTPPDVKICITFAIYFHFHAGVDRWEGSAAFNYFLLLVVIVHRQQGISR